MWHEKITHGVKIMVRPIYRRGNSSPRTGRYVWTYDVKIQNCRDEEIQLLNRFWRISDANGHVEEVQGPGVVGDRPMIKPLENYNYSSQTFISTPSGTMYGYYEMISTKGDSLKIDIPIFPLELPVRLVSSEPKLEQDALH